MSMSARKITQTFNGRAEWLIGGGAFFKILSSVNPVDVELYKEGGQALSALQVDSGFYQRIAFDRVVITTGALEPVSFLVAPDDGGSDTFSGVVSGTIDVTDRAARLVGVVDANYRSIAGDVEAAADASFIQTVNAAAGGAGVFHNVQVKNPAASGKIVVVRGFEISTSVAQLFSYGRRDADLPTLIGTLFNKNMGGAASTAQFRSESVAANRVTTIMGFSATIVTTLAKRVFVPPFRLAAGEGWALCQGTANSTITITVDVGEYSA